MLSILIVPAQMVTIIVVALICLVTAVVLVHFLVNVKNKDELDDSRVEFESRHKE